MRDLFKSCGAVAIEMRTSSLEVARQSTMLIDDVAAVSSYLQICPLPGATPGDGAPGDGTE